MAFKMTNTGFPKFPLVWNVSKRVGGHDYCENLPTDVELVKYLIRLGARSWSAYAQIGPRMTVNGSFDAILGYWIFRTQVASRHQMQVIDGIVSPARKGLMYAPKSPWVIVQINVFAMMEDEAGWRDLANNPLLSANLRRELSTATS